MIEQLFGSKTRVKLLQLFYTNPNRSFYVREITRKIDEQINSVRRELANLLSVGIIVSDNTNNKLYYEVNQQYEFYEPFLTLFGAKAAAASAKKAAPNGASKRTLAADAPEPADAASLKQLGHIELALYTGQFTRDESSGIDFLLVGDVNQNALTKYITGLEKQENKEIRYTLLTPDEFNYRVRIKDRFINNVLAAKKQVLIDVNGIL